jgi:nucleoid-associated protein YgaU
MGSLTAHLLEAGDHGRLAFHPSCPVCRQERLYGTLSSEPVVPRRAQALLAGGVLALSASAPVVAAAQEPDRQFEGAAAPEEPGGSELDDPSFDPGGDTELSFDTAPAPAAPQDGLDSGDGAPLDIEPTVDLDARLAPLADTDPSAGDEGAPPVESVPPVGSIPPGSAAPTAPSGSAAPGGGHGSVAQPGSPESPRSTPGTGLAAPPSNTSVAPAPNAGGLSSHRSDRPLQSRYMLNKVRSGAGAPASSERVSDGAAAPSVSYAVQVPATPNPATEPVAIVEADVAAQDEPVDRLDADSRFYIVQPGDSLWSIAKRLLGGDPSAGRIAREVNRLWTLNRSRIATGDPDLLMVGTRLELR